MLDLLISYFNFIILSIGYIVKKFTFFPPDPPHYKSIQTENENEEDILFLINVKKKKKKYIGIEFRLLDYRFIKIIDKNNKCLPLLLFHPPSNIPVCIIYSHGNSGDLGSCLLEYYEIALNTNCIVVAFEYPGYGECINQPIKESEFFKNLKMTYFFVKRVLGFKRSQIILYGFSLGTGIMFEMACRKGYSVAGLILQSPFLSILRTLYDMKPTSYYDLFNNCDKAKNLRIKTLFIHGNKDSMVPYIHGRILAKLIPQKYFYDFLTVDKADHNNIFKVNKDLIYKKIRQFIKDCTGKYSDFNNNKKKKKHNLEDSEKNIREVCNNKIQNSNNSKNIIISKSDIIKRTSTNILINNNYNLSLNSSFNNELRILMNNSYNSSFKNYYPSKIYNINKYHNKKKIHPKHKYSFYNRKKDNIYRFSDLKKMKGNFFSNYFFNINNIQGNLNNKYSKKILNTDENYFSNSTINKLNNSL